MGFTSDCERIKGEGDIIMWYIIVFVLLIIAELIFLCFFDDNRHGGNEY